MRRYAKNFFISISYLVLVRDYFVGIVLLILSFVQPSSCILALVSYVASSMFGRFIGLKKDDLIDGFFTYNSVLVGLGMGFLFKISFLSITFTIIASIFTLILSYGLHTLFTAFLRLPILNLPFTLMIIIIYLASARYGNLYMAKSGGGAWMNLDFLPLWIAGLLKSTGIIIFLPYDIVGIVILAALFIASRINFFLAVAGYYLGTLFLMLLKGSYYYAFTDINAFNFILIALALGGLFLIPSIKSYAIAGIGVLTSAIILDATNAFWSTFSIPVFTIPFILVTLPILYVMVITKSPKVTTVFLGTPEKNLEQFLNYSARFDLLMPQPHLPFSGVWKVYQGFNGEWTHKGIWSYGMDFVIENSADGKTFRNDGVGVDDYYCYNKPVLSPITGTVVDVCDDYEDNLIGTVDKQNNWGNYIIIESYWRYYVELSHFARKSITVKTGDRIATGQIIGRCGNSGYSPQPHLHMQVQYLGQIGSPSVPFRFIDAIVDNAYIGGTRAPSQNELVKPLGTARSLDHKFQLILDDEYRFGFYINSKLIKNISFKVSMDEEAAYYLSEPSSDARLYFSCIDGIFTFFRYDGNVGSPLRLLLLSLPRMPITEENITWHDRLSSMVVGKTGTLHGLLKSINPRLFTVNGSYRFSEPNSVQGTLEVNSFFKKKRIETKTVFNDFRFLSHIAVTIDGHTHELIRNEG